MSSWVSRSPCRYLSARPRKRPFMPLLVQIWSIDTQMTITRRCTEQLVWPPNMMFSHPLVGHLIEDVSIRIRTVYTLQNHPWYRRKLQCAIQCRQRSAVQRGHSRVSVIRMTSLCCSRALAFRGHVCLELSQSCCDRFLAWCPTPLCGSWFDEILIIHMWCGRSRWMSSCKLSSTLPRLRCRLWCHTPLLPFWWLKITLQIEGSRQVNQIRSITRCVHLIQHTYRWCPIKKIWFWTVKFCKRARNYEFRLEFENAS